MQRRIFAEFKSFWAQLFHHSASSVEQRTTLKARLADLAHLYCYSTIDSHDFSIHKECFRAINRLRKNYDVIITNVTKAPALFFYEVCLKNIGTVSFAQTTLATVIKALFFKMAQCLVVVKKLLYCSSSWDNFFSKYIYIFFSLVNK